MIDLKKNVLPLGTALAGMLTAPSLLAADNSPNIIMFLVDDMGWQETSVPFHTETTPLNKRFKTPNMEQLAAKGVKFMQAYSCAISSPSRCSLMSGMNAARHKVTNWTLNYNVNNDNIGGSLTLPDWHYNGIQPANASVNNATSITALPQVLQDNGYYTIHCGKAHFGAKNTAGEDPLNFGFDVNIAGGANGGPASYLGQDNYCSGSSDFCIKGLDQYASQNIFLTEALTQEACRVMGEHLDKNNGQPFYLYMSHYAIHSPYNADSRFTGNYSGKYDEQLGQVLNSTEVNIAALVEGMDKSLGDIMQFLDDRNIADNTIILFMSDNGGQAVWPRQGRLNRDQNYPARAGKGSAYMGGVREPMLVYWPGVTQAGTENHNPVMIEDFFPTIIEMAGITQYSTVQTVDGESFVNILKHPDQKRDRTIVWHFPNRWGESQDKNEGYGSYSAILKDSLHMIYFWETQERRLYNIITDISEQNNLVGQSDYYDAKLSELSQELTDLLISYDAQRPTQNGAEVSWPNNAVYEQSVSTGDAVTIVDGIFKFSDDNNKYYYSIQNHRGSGTEDNGGPFYWTLGTHNGYKAVQATMDDKTGGDDKNLQLFYFTRGADSKTFRIHTYNGGNIDYVNGLTVDGWNNGNTTSGTSTYKFMQYDTENGGQFQAIKSDTDGYYGIKHTESGDLMNDRGTKFGSAANMNWVINNYNGNTTGDPGSRYKFTLVEQTQTSVEFPFQLSDDNNKYYYSIQDNRGTGSGETVGPFFWTLGSHNGYNAIQATTEDKTGTNDKNTQLFYFTAGNSANTFKIHTRAGQNVDYVNGLTVDAWNNGNTTSGTSTYKFMQYGTTGSGEFQTEKIANVPDYYGIRHSSGDLLNNRGTKFGTAANMNWVVNTYNGNTTGDTGSQYKFTLMEQYPGTSGIENSFAENPFSAMTREELHQTQGLRIFGIDGRQVSNVLTAAPGIYVVLKDSQAHKIFLK